MKKHVIILSLLLFCCSFSFAQSRKSVSILGDSYSTFQDYLEPDSNEVWYKVPNNPKNTDVTKVEQTWWHKFIKENGFKLCKNNSYSGSTICFTGYKGADYTSRSFVTRMDNLGCPDIIFIFGATNDSWANAPIGEYKHEGYDKKDLFTFRPALSKMLSFMVNRYPNTQIYFLINDGLKDEITESIKSECNYYNVPFIELNGIDKIHGHPSIKGMAQIAEQIKAQFDFSK